MGTGGRKKIEDLEPGDFMDNRSVPGTDELKLEIQVDLRRTVDNEDCKYLLKMVNIELVPGKSVYTKAVIGNLKGNWLMSIQIF